MNKHQRWIVEYADGEVGTYSSSEPITRREAEKELERAAGGWDYKRAIQLIPSIADRPKPKVKS